MLPASFAQQRMWFLERFEGGAALYNVPAVDRLRGPLDVDALERALERADRAARVAAHGVHARDGVPHQVDPAGAAVHRWTVDLSDDPDAEERGAGDRLATGSRRPSTSPRTTLFRVVAREARRGRPHPVADAPSHRHRRVVDGSAESRARRRCTPGLRRGPRGRAARSSDSSTPTTRSGSSSGWRAEAWTSSSTTGGRSSRVRHRCSSCPPTTPAPPGRASGARRSATMLPLSLLERRPSAGRARAGDACS